MSAKGFAAEETRAALARVGESRANITEKYPIYYAQFAWSYMRGELHQARRLAESFLREAELGGHATEAAVARRILGSTCLLQGDLWRPKPSWNARWPITRRASMPKRGSTSATMYGP